MELRFRLAVVTGAGSPYGREVAVRLARAGAGVLVVDGDAEAARETVRAVREHRVWVSPVQLDTTEEDDVCMLAARVRDLGGVALVLDTVGGPHAALLRELIAREQPSPRWLDAATLAACSGREALSLLRAG